MHLRYRLSRFVMGLLKIPCSYSQLNFRQCLYIEISQTNTDYILSYYYAKSMICKKNRMIKNHQVKILQKY